MDYVLQHGVWSTPVVSRALGFAEATHAGQVRKYTGEPYITHCLAVADLLIRNAASVTPATVAAAVMHDCFEDAPHPHATIRAAQRLFDTEIVKLVLEVTDVSRPVDGNRAARKTKDRLHLAQASFWGQTIKYADLIDNTSSIVAHDLDFAKVYLQEKEMLLASMTNGHAGLRARALGSLYAAKQAIDRQEAGLGDPVVA